MTGKGKSHLKRLSQIGLALVVFVDIFCQFALVQIPLLCLVSSLLAISFVVLKVLCNKQDRTVEM